LRSSPGSAARRCAGAEWRGEEDEVRQREDRDSPPRSQRLERPRMRLHVPPPHAGRKDRPASPAVYRLTDSMQRIVSPTAVMVLSVIVEEGGPWPRTNVTFSSARTASSVPSTDPSRCTACSKRALRHAV